MNLYDYVKLNRIVQNDQIEVALSYFSDREYKKGDHFNVHHGFDEYMGYLEQGLVVYYTYVNGNKCIVDILSEGDWVAHFDNTKPSQVIIEFLEDSKMTVISQEKMTELSNIYPEIAVFKAKVIHHYLAIMTERAVDRSTLSASERLNKFLSKDASLFNRIPQNYIASFLGIRPQSLSRIKKKAKPSIS